MLRVILLAGILMMVGGAFYPYPLILASTKATETSIVTLLLKSDETVIETDPLFEILDLQSYILVPINKLPARIELQIDFRRDQNLLLVADRNSRRQVTVDFNKRVYRVADQPQWPEQAPLILNNEFFVAPMLIEYLTGIKIEWSFKYQELTFQGDWKVPVTPGASGTSDHLPSRSASTRDLIYQEGPACSIGTVRYELTWEYQKDEFGRTSSEGQLKLRGDGRAGQWALSLGGEVEYEAKDNDPNAELSLIRAKYNDQNKLVIFGDSNIFLENTLRQQNIRGVLMISPDHAFSRLLIPYTSVYGKAQPGDKVVLYVNGKPFDETLINPGQDSYSFTDVPLAVKRLNILKIVIEKPSGECLVTEKTLSSSLRVLDQSTNEWLIAGGAYRQDESEAWDKKLAAVKVKKALTANLSLDSEVVATQQRQSGAMIEKILYGADTGIAFRLGQNTICTLDWLVGGTTAEPAQGWKTAALYCLEKGFIEGILFYVDPTVTRDEMVDSDHGRGFKLLGELEINEQVTYQAKAEVTEPLKEMEQYVAKHFELRRNRKYGPKLENMLTLGIKKERTVDDDSKDFEDLSRIFMDQSVYGKNTNLRNYLGFDQLKSEATDGIVKTAGINVETDYIRMFSDLSIFNLSALAKHHYGDAELNLLNFESNLKWLGRDRSAGIYLSATLYGETNPLNSTVQKTPFKMDTGSLGVWGKYFFTAERSLYAAWDWNIYDRYAAYTYGVINYTQLLDHGKAKYYGEYSYASPFNYRTNTPHREVVKIDRPAQHSYRLGISRRTKQGLEIKLEIERLYENLTAGNPQQVYRLTCGQAIGFGSKRLKTIASDHENLSLVSGIVFLDANGNNQYDKDEKTLPEIRMSLNGRRVTTNESGEYLYQNVEPDAYRLFFDLSSLSADYTPVTEAKLFKLKENENRFFDFGVTLNGSISGKVFIDQNGNRIYDPGEQPLNWVAIILDHGKKKVFTGNDGGFYFENIPLGEHSIAVLTESLPPDLVISGRKTFACGIKENALDIRDINIPVVYRFKP